MNQLLKLEAFALFILSGYFLIKIDFGVNGWILFFLFLSPDISMLGYLHNTKTGAFFYNLFHHKFISTIFLASGYFLKLDYFLLTGLILFSHASFDRIFGYGLKYPDSFKHTHLGWLK
jgi:hypothetical protein